MINFLSFANFCLLEARTTVHFRDRLAERTFEENIDLGLPGSFWKNFNNAKYLESAIKAKIAKMVEEKSYILIGKTYSDTEAVMALLLDPKVEYQGKLYNTSLKVTAKDKGGNTRTLQGPYWAIIVNNTLLTIFNREDKGDDSLIFELKEHIKREQQPEMYNKIERFIIDRKTVDALQNIKVDDSGNVVDETPKHIALNVKEFQTVVRPGMDITYYGFGPDKNLIKKTATIESIVKLNGQPIDFKNESDVSPGIKVFFTNKASKSFLPNKDVIVIDGQKAEITRIFLDKRMANPINFMVKVKSVKE